MSTNSAEKHYRSFLKEMANVLDGVTIIVPLTDGDRSRSLANDFVRLIFLLCSCSLKEMYWYFIHIFIEQENQAIKRV